MFYYIHKDLLTNYIILEEELDVDNYLIGTTMEEFYKNYYIQLNEEQIKFLEENPSASAVEIFNMELTPIAEPTLEEVKLNKVKEIDVYDNSIAVNNFKINDSINTWFTVAERNNYCASINAAKTVGLDTLSFFVGDIKLEIGTAMAEGMLAQIQLYADACFIVTKQHKMNVEALTTIEEVNNYDYTIGYPEQLNFQLG
jgi:hypothetical protein